MFLNTIGHFSFVCRKSMSKLVGYKKDKSERVQLEKRHLYNPFSQPVLLALIFLAAQSPEAGFRGMASISVQLNSCGSHSSESWIVFLTLTQQFEALYSNCLPGDLSFARELK